MRTMEKGRNRILWALPNTRAGIMKKTGMCRRAIDVQINAMIEAGTLSFTLIADSRGRLQTKHYHKPVNDLFGRN